MLFVGWLVVFGIRFAFVTIDVGEPHFDDTVNTRQMQHCIVRFSLRSLWIYLVWNSRRRSGSL